MGKEASTSYFAGGNTAQGFISLFRYIPGSETKRLLIIKGGPGTGKSTLLKRLQAKALAAGLKTELFYCSSDPASLDGLSVPALGFAAVDGTAPHTMDPVLPGAYDEIVDFGQCWRKEKLQSKRHVIAELAGRKSLCFSQAYQYLKEGAVVLDKLRWLTARAMDYRAANRMVLRLLGELADALPQKEEEPKERQLFAGAITPKGFLNFYPSIFKGLERFYYLTGEPGTGKSFLLGRIRQTVKDAGYQLYTFRCSFDPQRVDAVVIPAIKTAFVKMTYPHTFSLDPLQLVREQSTIALNRYINTALFKKYTAERTENTERFWYLLGKAVEFLRHAKQAHEKLEEIYREAMDYRCLEKLQGQLSEELLADNHLPGQ